jgi:lysophospholipase L1-like esterase
MFRNRIQADLLNVVGLWNRRNIEKYCVVLLLTTAAVASQQPVIGQTVISRGNWVATWSASSVDNGSDAKHVRGQTVREIVHTSIGGNAVRLRISNKFGQERLMIGAVHVALRDTGSAVILSTDHSVTFSGQPSISVPPGTMVLSDPIPLRVPTQADLAISIYIPQDVAERTIHPDAFQDSYLSPTGDFVGAASILNATTIQTWPFLVGLDVAVGASAATIVALGDSITDGTQSTPNSNQRWPNLLAERLFARSSKNKFGVIDAGISGNRLLLDSGSAGPSALERFDRDVLIQPGAQYVIVLEGINDVGAPGPYRPLSETVTAGDLIVAFRQLIARAHERGVKIFGCTLTPFQGAVPYYNLANEAKREELNQWIRTSNAFDGVIDFDKALRDPKDPKRLLPQYESRDHLHPSDAGYKAMADAIDLNLFQ